MNETLTFLRTVLQKRHVHAQDERSIYSTIVHHLSAPRPTNANILSTHRHRRIHSTPKTRTMTGSPNLPDLPLTNLGNAEFTATKAAFSGENTVIGECSPLGAP